MEIRTPGTLVRRCVVAGAALMALGVLLGAFGAHGLQGTLTPRQLASYQTGVHYQMLHAIGDVSRERIALGTSLYPWIRFRGLTIS